MERLGASVVRSLIATARKHGLLPDDALCESCAYPILDHPAVEQAISQRGLSRASCCRCSQSHQERMDRWERYANIPKRDYRRTFENFRSRPGTEQAVDLMQRVASRQECRMVSVLSGDTGTGKSHLVEAAGWHLLSIATRPRYEYYPSLLMRLRGAFGPQSTTVFDDEFRPALYSPILLLDEIGLRDTPTAWEIEQLTILVDTRMREGRRTVVTTNMNRHDLASRFGSRLESRLLDVHSSAVDWVTLSCGDYRVAGP